MILSDLLGTAVLDAAGTRLGCVVDARFALDGMPGETLAQPRLHGVVVSPRGHSTFLGYERDTMDKPAVIARILAWRERGSFLVLWRDLASIADGAITLRHGYTRYSTTIVER